MPADPDRSTLIVHRAAEDPPADPVRRGAGAPARPKRGRETAAPTRLCAHPRASRAGRGRGPGARFVSSLRMQHATDVSRDLLVCRSVRATATVDCASQPGRVAQWESARFTRERSLVRAQPCPYVGSSCELADVAPHQPHPRGRWCSVMSSAACAHGSSCSPRSSWDSSLVPAGVGGAEIERVPEAEAYPSGRAANQRLARIRRHMVGLT
jgi:hypothetical protein